MGRHVIKQPNNKYAIWSTIVDNFIMTDATREDYINFRIEEETERVKKDLTEIFDKVDKGDRYHHTVHQWNEALSLLEEIHGRDELDKLLRGLDNGLS